MGKIGKIEATQMLKSGYEVVKELLDIDKRWVRDCSQNQVLKSL